MVAISDSEDPKYLPTEHTNALASEVLDFFLTRGLTPDQAVAVLALTWQRIKGGELDAGTLNH